MNNILAYMMVLISKDTDVNLTKLNKLIFFCDIAYYLENKDLISEESYLKLPRGPVAKNANDTRYTLISNNILIETTIEHNLYMEYKYKANNKLKFENIKKAIDDKKPNASNKIQNTVNMLSDYTASELSYITHKYEPWISAKIWGEKLDISLVNKDKEFKEWLYYNKLIDSSK